MNAKHIAIIDYGMGNLHSVASAVQHVAPDVKIDVTADPQRIADADHVIFPGVGAIRDCMAEILRLNLDKVVADVIAQGKPLLAICVGMQALMNRSEENDGVACLGHFDGEVKYFSDSEEFKVNANAQSTQSQEVQDHLKVPHMGWNQVNQSIDHPLWANIANDSRFYFVHSYYIEMQNAEKRAGECHYGLGFTSAISDKNVFAVQFHPEKSHKDGLQLLKNFVQWDGKVS
ncbi:MAG: imidazole glycerol phosphate synthase subunit HisH [Alteromonadaceae bacterium]|nr:MAG: imidazole glycerol phosphate synthase subunit HisH [Alteromonadaceae bacterium]